MEYDDNDVDTFKTQIENLMEGRETTYADIVALIEVALEGCVDIGGSGPEGTMLFLTAIAPAPIMAAEYAHELPEVH
jgi:hypothetical protein